ncbi:SitI3 family protein [Kribbella sp. NPDC056345]|uniref:SitI3 family protein n=1 Tax=Kribbella sp. NPDC056345 TaxID=3345789 RepID=UPI0035DC35FC
MAIEYTFQLCTATPAEVISRLLVPEVWYLTTHKTATGLRITVHPVSRPNLVLGEPEISVGFRLDKFEEPGPQYDEIAGHVVTLLTAEAGDAVLQQDFERIFLLRRGTQLVVSESFWAPELLPWPFERRATMPYPED